MRGIEIGVFDAAESISGVYLVVNVNVKDPLDINVKGYDP